MAESNGSPPSLQQKGHISGTPCKKATQKNTSTPQITDGILLSSQVVVLVLVYSLVGASDGVLGSLRL
jgi:hypothetical protein